MAGGSYFIAFRPQVGLERGAKTKNEMNVSFRRSRHTGLLEWLATDQGKNTTKKDALDVVIAPPLQLVGPEVIAWVGTPGLQQC